MRAAKFALFAVPLVGGIFPLNSQFPVAGLSGTCCGAIVAAVARLVIRIDGTGSPPVIDGIATGVFSSGIVTFLIIPGLHQRPFPFIRHRVFQRAQ